ncbi:MAG: hypothetical protein Q9185_001774 [Variospora sp. 1 TL-2023]
MQKDALADSSTDIESFSSSSIRQNSSALTPPTSISDPTAAPPEHQTPIRNPLPDDSIFAPPKLPPQAPVARLGSHASLNLSGSTTWTNPVGGQACVLSSRHDLHATTSESRSLVQRMFDRSWVQPTIGLTTLLITLIALFVYSHRAFVMAKWTERNDMLQACAELVQSCTNVTYPQCEDMLASGPRPPPYLEGRISTRAARVYDLGGRLRGITRPMQYLRFAPGYADVENDPQLKDPSIFHPRSKDGTHPLYIFVIVVCGICALAVGSAVFMLARQLRRRRRTSHIFKRGGRCGVKLSTFLDEPTSRDGK